jgi:hypothetical protein
MNRVFRTVFFTFTLLLATPSWSANNNNVSLADWIKELPATIDGVTIFRPVEDEGKLQISDLIDMPNTSRETIYVNAMVEIRTNFDSEIEEFDKIDHEGMRYCLTRSIYDENSDATFSYTIAVQAIDNIFSFIVTDISINFKEKGLIPRTVAIEKMKPYKDKRHKDLVEQCAVSISNYINQITSAISSRGKVKLTHWTDIRQGNIVKGMTPDEVVLVKGRPTSNRQSNSRVKWMYGNENVVIFTDGKVSNIIQ